MYMYMVHVQVHVDDVVIRISMWYDNAHSHGTCIYIVHVYGTCTCTCR